LAETCAGERGEFELRIPASKSGSEASTGEVQAGAARGPRSFQVWVRDAKGHLLLQDDATYEAVGTLVTYRELVVPDRSDARGGSQATK
jgi:hypothetical protein